MTRTKATSNEITVFEQSTASEFLGCFDGDQTMMEMLQGFGEVPVTRENDERWKRDRRRQAKLLDGRTVEQIEDVQQRIEQDLKRIHGELILSFHVFDEFLEIETSMCRRVDFDLLARDFDPRYSAER